jgi:transposase
MTPSISLRPQERNSLLLYYRRSGCPEQRLRANILLLLADGWAWATIAALLFCAHLDELRRAFRRYKVIHVICDNVRTHKEEGSRLVRACLAKWGGRVKLHYLPSYAPECNLIERAWWRLHEAVTRNHRCASMEELLDLTFAWFGEKPKFGFDRRIYHETGPA